mmetsp:Transcript_33230/g.98762  ORF Transcript_33230/g.98762 Transcript_33230/m.98762 type:complete len:262 (+) Transcript_33230:1740-2525(+)
MRMRVRDLERMAGNGRWRSRDWVTWTVGRISGRKAEPSSQGHGRHRRCGWRRSRGRLPLPAPLRGSRRGVVHLGCRPLFPFLRDPLERRIPSILNGVVGPAVQQLGDLGPPGPQSSGRFDDHLVLLLHPLSAVDVRIEVIVPALPALLPQSSLELLGDERPLLLPVLMDQLCHLRVLLGSPRTLDQSGLEDLLPSMEALDVGAIGEDFGDLLPVLGRVGVHGDPEGLILPDGPLPRRGAALDAARRRRRRRRRQRRGRRGS